MFNISELTQYKENNRLEVKKAQKGLPGSIWETYSAFANTEGGIIVLGIAEAKDHSFSVCGVNDAHKIVSDFWNTINNNQKVSANILTERMVRIETVDGKEIVVIEVPRADRSIRPVYLNQNPESGTYHRNFEGDYHCTKEQLSAIFRDACDITADRKILCDMDMSVFCDQTLKDYRNRFKAFHSNHIWNNCDNEQFLRNIGAMQLSASDNKFHPTVAGLLMFGYEYEILREIPLYFLDYQEMFDPKIRWTHRTVSSSGDWSGNLYDFFWRVYPRLKSILPVPFNISDGVSRIDEPHTHIAVREFLLNAIVHADHYGRRGVVIRCSNNTIDFSNPGDMRVGLNVALSGGVSDPRNGLLMKMFSLVNIGERAGTGMPDAISAMRDELKATVRYSVQLDPTRTEIHISMPNCTRNSENCTENPSDCTENSGNCTENTGDCTENTENCTENTGNFTENSGNCTENSGDCTRNAQKNDSTTDISQKILMLIKANKNITTIEMSEKLGISLRNVAMKIRALQDGNIIKRQGPDKGGCWIVL